MNTTIFGGFPPPAQMAVLGESVQITGTNFDTAGFVLADRPSRFDPLNMSVNRGIFFGNGGSAPGIETSNEFTAATDLAQFKNRVQTELQTLSNEEKLEYIEQLSGAVAGKFNSSQSDDVSLLRTRLEFVHWLSGEAGLAHDSIPVKDEKNPIQSCNANLWNLFDNLASVAVKIEKKLIEKRAIYQEDAYELITDILFIMATKGALFYDHQNGRPDNVFRQLPGVLARYNELSVRGSKTASDKLDRARVVMADIRECFGITAESPEGHEEEWAIEDVNIMIDSYIENTFVSNSISSAGSRGNYRFAAEVFEYYAKRSLRAAANKAMAGRERAEFWKPLAEAGEVFYNKAKEARILGFEIGICQLRHPLTDGFVSRDNINKSFIEELVEAVHNYFKEKIAATAERHFGGEAGLIKEIEGDLFWGRSRDVYNFLKEIADWFRMTSAENEDFVSRIWDRVEGQYGAYRSLAEQIGGNWRHSSQSEPPVPRVSLAKGFPGVGVMIIDGIKVLVEVIEAAPDAILVTTSKRRELGYDGMQFWALDYKGDNWELVKPDQDLFRHGFWFANINKLFREGKLFETEVIEKNGNMHLVREKDSGRLTAWSVCPNTGYVAGENCIYFPASKRYVRNYDPIPVNVVERQGNGYLIEYNGRLDYVRVDPDTGETDNPHTQYLPKIGLFGKLFSTDRLIDVDIVEQVGDAYLLKPMEGYQPGVLLGWHVTNQKTGEAEKLKAGYFPRIRKFILDGHDLEFKLEGVDEGYVKILEEDESGFLIEVEKRVNKDTSPYRIIRVRIPKQPSREEVAIEVLKGAYKGEETVPHEVEEAVEIEQTEAEKTEADRPEAIDQAGAEAQSSQEESWKGGFLNRLELDDSETITSGNKEPVKPAEPAEPSRTDNWFSKLELD